MFLPDHKYSGSLLRLRSWFNRMLRGMSARSTTGRRTRRYSFRPRLEALEEIIAPSTVTINTDSLTVNGAKTFYGVPFTARLTDNNQVAEFDIAGNLKVPAGDDITAVGTHNRGVRLVVGNDAYIGGNSFFNFSAGEFAPGPGGGSSNSGAGITAGQLIGGKGGSGTLGGAGGGALAIVANGFLTGDIYYEFFNAYGEGVFPGAQAGGGQGGTIELVGSVVPPGPNYFEVAAEGGSSSYPGPGFTYAGDGRFVFGTNTTGTVLSERYGATLITTTGPVDPNPFLSSSAATPTIPDLKGGAEAYGLLSSPYNASYLPGFASGSPAEIIRVHNTASFPGNIYPEDFAGYDMVFLVNETNAPLSNPSLGIGTSGYLQPLLQGGYVNNPLFTPGGKGPQTLTTLPAYSVYMTLVPSSATVVNASFGANGTTYTLNGATLVNGGTQSEFITQNPTNQTVISGQMAPATFTAAGVAPSDSVQWYVSSRGGPFTALSNGGNYSGVTTSTLSITSTSSSLNNNQYEAVVTHGASSATSKPATLAVDFLTSGPTNQLVDNGYSTSFLAATSVATDTVFWSASTDGGKTFTQLTNSGSYSGVTTRTLAISNATSALNNTQYKATFSNTAGSITTGAATLSVDYVTANPTNVSILSGQSGSFTANDSNPLGTDRFAWYVSTDGGRTFVPLTSGGIYSGTSTKTLTITNATTGLNGNEYEAYFLNSAGSFSSAPATLQVLLTQDLLLKQLVGSGTQAIAIDPYNQYRLASNGGVATDGPGNYYVTGSVRLGVYPFDQVAFVSKMNSKGQVLWTKDLGVGFQAQAAGTGVAVDSLGNVYVTGSYYGTGDFNPGTATSNLTSAPASKAPFGNDIFVTKLDANGNYVWATDLGAGFGEGIALDHSANVVVASQSYTSNNSTATVTKLDTSGRRLWSRQIGPLGSGQGVAVDGAGNVYATGYFSGTFQAGNGTIASYGTYNAFVVKMDSLGNLVWGADLGSGNLTEGLALALDAQSNVYTTGFFYGTGDFDPGPSTHTLSGTLSNGFYSSTIYVSKLDAAGKFVWAEQLGTGADYAHGEGIALDSLGDVYVSGQVAGTGNFDPGSSVSNLATGGATDGFVVAFKQPPTPPTVDQDPVSRNINAGQKATFTAVSSNPKDTVAWFVSSDGGRTYAPLNNGGAYGGVTTTQLTITGATADLNNDRYEAVFTNAVGPTPSQPATLGVDYVTGIPGNQTATVGQVATFTATSANPSNTDTVQWYVSTNNGGNYVPLVNNALYSGAQTGTLTINSVPTSLEGADYVAVFTNAAGSFTFSPAAQLTVVGPLAYDLSNVQATAFSVQYNPTNGNLELVDNNGHLLNSLPLIDATAVSITGLTGGGDTLTLDYRNGYFTVPGGIQFNGGGNGTLQIVGGAFDNLTDNPQLPGSGTLLLHPGSGDDTTITYNGLAPINVLADLGNVTMNLPAGAQDAFLADSGITGLETIGATGASFERLTFVDPSATLTINGTPNAAERLTVRSLDPSFQANLNIDLQGGADEIDFTGPQNLGAGSISATAATITDVGAPLTTAAGSITLKAENSLALAASLNAGGAVTLSTATGGITQSSGTIGASGTVSLDTSGSIGSSGNRIAFDAVNSPARIVLGAATRPSAVYLDGTGSLTLGSIATTGGPIDVTARTNLQVVANALLNPGASTLSLGADLKPDGTGDDGVGTLSIGANATLYGVSIDLRGADVEIDSTANVGNPGIGTFVNQGQGLHQPISIAVDANGNFFVANQTTNVISEVSPTGVVSTFVSQGPYDPFSVAFDAADNLYVANFGGNSISKITPAGVVSTFVDSTQGLLNPASLAFDANGNLYVGNYGNNTISKVTPDGVVSTFVDGTHGLAFPYGLAVDSHGNLFVANYYNSTVSEVTPAGAVSVFANLYAPIGLAFDSSGNLYVAGGYGVIDELAPNGAIIQVFSGGFQGPQGEAFGKDGNLYVVNYFGSTISKVTLHTPGTEQIAIRSSLPSLPMNLGGTNDAAVAGINLTSTELARLFTVTSGTITVGDSAQTGNITFAGATPASATGAALVVVQSATGAGQIILDNSNGPALSSNGGGALTLNAGTGGIIESTGNLSGVADLATTGTLTLNTIGPIGASAQPLQVDAINNPAALVIGPAVPSGSVYLVALGSSLNLASVAIPSGTLNLTAASVSLTSGDTLSFQLNSPTLYSQLLVSGDLYLNNVSLGAIVGYTPTVSDQFTLLLTTAGTIHGQFAQGSSLIVGVHTYDIVYTPQSVILDCIA